MFQRRACLVLVVALFSSLGCSVLNKDREESDNQGDDFGHPYDAHPYDVPDSYLPGPPNVVFSKYSISSDSNGDKKVNKGESVAIWVYLKNTGTSKAQNVKAELSTDDDYVTISSSSYQNPNSYGELDLNEESAGSYEFFFTVAQEAPAGHQIPFSLAITDSAGNSWTDNFEIQVVSTGANVVFSKYSISSDSNGDKKVNKGESVAIWVYLKNTGTSKVQNVKAELSTDDDYVTITSSSYQNPNSYSELDPNEESAGSYEFFFTVAQEAPAGHQIPFSLAITDSAGNSWTDNFEIQVVSTGANVVFSKYSISSDSNGDKKVNKGESVAIWVYLKNTGTSKVQNVKAELSTDDGYVTITSSSYQNPNSYSELDPNEESAGSYEFFFTVGQEAPVGHQVPFSLAITDNAGNSWTDNFEIQVVSTGANVVFSKYSISSDSNGDEKVNKGESVAIWVYLKNTGTSKAQNVKAELSTDDDYVTITSSSYQNPNSYSDLDPNEESAGSYEFFFTVTQGAPAGHQIPFSLAITDSAGNSWTDNFEIQVVSTGANVVFSKYSISSDSNGDKQVNKGESVAIYVYLKNAGTSKALNVKAMLSTTDTYVTITSSSYQNPNSYSDLDPNEEFAGSYEFFFTVAQGAPAGHQIPFSLAITDSQGNTWSGGFQVPVQ